MDNTFGQLMKRALPDILPQFSRYLNEPWRLIDSDPETQALMVLDALLREARRCIDAHHDDMQARYVRRKLYQLGHSIASASGGGFLRSAVSTQEKQRLEFLKEILAC
ncbi:hypothetical protein [Chitinilyticum litopenaei]|uniref:hypothetical protein n=1 Tax=Chitinilyticum litopenaei TaxID=1121276 RepID=UPI000420DFC8|nr:hypothetical protein [Chitinilyticum litopenaei]